ncbi:MAG TPA: alpha/beta hydrolase [Allosphingosinicella sp.]|nr:alpha/beta hydrolase [Allosphingosinicella sp.]
MEEASERPAAPPDPEAVELVAANGIKLCGTYRRAVDPKALILLFHQRGSSRAEYFEIAPRLAANGYSSLAIDQRGGGDRWRVPNRTAEQWGETQSHLEAMPDLEAAFAWGAAQGLPLVLWGSSYSAALVFLLAAAHPGQVRALLAFSPGDYVEGGLVVAAARELHVPVFITSATTLNEVGYAQPVFDAVGSADKTYFLPAEGGEHGSLTLIRSENPDGYEEMWGAVLSFLQRLTS